MAISELDRLFRLIRYYILLSSTTAGSGHPTSSLSATDLMTVLFFKYFRFDLENPDNPNNDRLIFSKGHATPLLYSLYTAAGKITEAELLKYRTFDSPLEGHPSMRFPYTEVPTGSLGQGLSVGVGIALAMKRNQELGIRNSGEARSRSARQNDHNSPNYPSYLKRGLGGVSLPKVYVLLGDGEMAEGSMWEAIQIASYYKLNNLVAILDVNRLGQSQETMLGHDTEAYARRVSSFGWKTYVVPDGHDLEEIDQVFSRAMGPYSDPTPPDLPFPKGEEFSPSLGKRGLGGVGPTMIIAKTIKGKGVSFLENVEGRHGVALKKEEFEKALSKLGKVDKSIRGQVKKPVLTTSRESKLSFDSEAKLYTKYRRDDKVATRKAYGTGLVRLGKMYSDIVSLDGDVKNSTYSEKFKKEFPDRFFEMFIAEQNMVGAAAGMAKLGFRPFVSTFACFLTRAADQIRMTQYAGLPIVFCGSHAGVSIGQDGPSQMGLEDLSLFRTILNSIVLYASDAVMTERLVEEAYNSRQLVYIRTSRPDTPVLYNAKETFPIGKSKTLKSSANDRVTIIGAGITVFEALKATEELKKLGIAARVIDCYSIKPIDINTFKKAARETKAIITVEDHYPVGGLGDAVLEALADQPKVPIYKLAVRKTPRSGEPEELLDFEEISARAIIEKVKSLKVLR